MFPPSWLGTLPQIMQVGQCSTNQQSIALEMHENETVAHSDKSLGFGSSAEPKAGQNLVGGKKYCFFS